MKTVISLLLLLVLFDIANIFIVLETYYHYAHSYVQIM